MACYSEKQHVEELLQGHSQSREEKTQFILLFMPIIFNAWQRPAG